jgi:hypothetical protein
VPCVPILLARDRWMTLPYTHLTINVMYGVCPIIRLYPADRSFVPIARLNETSRARAFPSIYARPAKPATAQRDRWWLPFNEMGEGITTGLCWDVEAFISGWATVGRQDGTGSSEDVNRGG